jgi:serine phosphatase RsbU (regulator of sigma subunit)
VIKEAMNEYDLFFGYEEITNILKEKHNQSSQDLIKSTMTKLERFRGVKEPNDDITLVVLKVL